MEVPQLYYSIDVECVATAPDHNSRAVAQIALVDQFEQVVLNLYVRPDRPVVSYLTALTGLTADMVENYGRPLAEQVELLKRYLPKEAALVGQNILMDVQWLGLKEGADFASCIDLAGLYRAWNPRYNSWSVFSQDHCAKHLLGWDVDSASHDAAGDAAKSIRLFNYWQQLHSDADAWRRAQEALLGAPPSQSFAKKHPSYDGVCMGNRRTCTCGAPFFS
ncbi:MAG: ribonuclease H-like domain-containing protein [Monoraphidium minutum]|nr:MAG: ribonuclease H-like domain-containing protein [Monoraphidium minutum]